MKKTITQIRKLDLKGKILVTLYPDDLKKRDTYVANTDMIETFISCSALAWHNDKQLKSKNMDQKFLQDLVERFLEYQLNKANAQIFYGKEENND